MSLTSGKPPAEGEIVISDAISKLMRANSNHLEMALRGTSNLAITRPFEVYSLSLDQTLAHDLNLATSVGWSYIGMAGQQATSLIEIRTRVGGNASFSHINVGMLTDEVVSAILAAEASEKVQEKDYEGRILRIPSLDTAALWLHNANDDFLIPLSPKSIFPVQERCNAEEFFSRLASLREDRSSFDNSPKKE